MTYIVDGWNNFCRVFEFDNCYCVSNKHCPVDCKLVDSFSPVSHISHPGCSKDVYKAAGEPYLVKEVSHTELREDLLSVLENKEYRDLNKKYLVLTEFGASFLI